MEQVLGENAHTAYAQHFDTRLRLGPAREGEWLRLLPESRIDAAAWFQTVLTFGQLVSELQRCLRENYGVPAEFGEVAELARDALPKSDVF